MSGCCSDVDPRAHLCLTKEMDFILLAFPRDPVIEISPSLAAAEPVTVTCKILDVYPSHYLEVLLKKEDHVLLEKNFYEDESTNTENKTVTYSFNPTAEDIGKEFTCVAKLPIPNMDFELKERVTSERLTANCKHFHSRLFTPIPVQCEVSWNGFPQCEL